MTCIVGVRDRKNKRLYLGGDSCGSNGYTAHNIKQSKVFAKGEFLIGYTTSFRMGQIIERFLTPPPILPNKKLYYYMIDDFVPAIMKILKDHNWATNKDNKETGGVFIVGIRDSLFKIQSDYSINEYHDDFMTCGCGEDHANGSLFNDTLNKAAVIRALKAASHFSAMVGPPFKVLSRRYE